MQFFTLGQLELVATTRRTLLSIRGQNSKRRPGVNEAAMLQRSGCCHLRRSFNNGYGSSKNFNKDDYGQ